MSTKFKNCCFTAWRCPEFCSKKITYAIYGIEICPKTGRTHYQGFLQLECSYGIIGIKKIIGSGDETHVEKMKGTPAEARDYCMKDGNYVEFGVIREHIRKDLNDIRSKLDETGRISSVIDDLKNVQQIRFAELYLKYKEKKRDWIPEVIWIHGKTGVGKTRRAIELAGKDYWMSAKNLKWWEGYDGHECVIIDEFRKDYCTFHELLRILDSTEYRIEVKGGSRQLLAKKIIITSCYHPRAVYETREDYHQLLRRISYIVDMSSGAQESGGNTEPPTYFEEY